MGLLVVSRFFYVVQSNFLHCRVLVRKYLVIVEVKPKEKEKKNIYYQLYFDITENIKGILTCTNISTRPGMNPFCNIS